MKDEHLTTALHKALTRYGTSELPADAHVEGVTRPPRRPSLGESLRRKPGWVTVSEIEASQSPNTYPRLTRRAIKARCKELAHKGGTPIEEVRTVGLRSWVRVAAPRPSARDDVGEEGETAATAPITASVNAPFRAPVTEQVNELVIDIGQPVAGHGDADTTRDVFETAALAIGMDIDLDIDLDIIDRA